MSEYEDKSGKYKYWLTHILGIGNIKIGRLIQCAGMHRQFTICRKKSWEIYTELRLAM